MDGRSANLNSQRLPDPCADRGGWSLGRSSCCGWPSRRRARSLRRAQRLLLRSGIEAVSLGEVSLAVCFRPTASVDVQIVRGGCAACPAARGFADPVPKQVVSVAIHLAALQAVDFQGPASCGTPIDMCVVPRSLRRKR